MQKWQDYANYMKHRNADGSYTYIVTVDGQDVEVSEVVYKAYAAGGRKMRYMELDLKCDRVLQDEDGRAVLDGNGLPVALPEREVSLDKLIGEDWDFSSSEPSPEDIVMERFEIETLYKCLGRLDADERALIDALFFDGLTEREYSAKSSIPQKTINDRKLRVLGKLKNYLQK